MRRPLHVPTLRHVGAARGDTRGKPAALFTRSRQATPDTTGNDRARGKCAQQVCKCTGTVQRAELMSSLALAAVAADPASPVHEQIESFRHFAASRRSTKVNLRADVTAGSEHQYQTMYGLLLMPMRNASRAPKLFEIGIGCHSHGRGKPWGRPVWLDLLPQAEVWMADHRQQCAEFGRQSGLLRGIRGTVWGDQGDPLVVKQWVQQTGGQFDVVVDDGGHTNRQIKTTFDILWPELKPGGYYFIEDLQVGRDRGFRDADQTAWPPISALLQSWIEALVIRKGAALMPFPQHPLPANVSFILCQADACVISKRVRSDQRRLSERSMRMQGAIKSNVALPLARTRASG